MLHTYFVYNTDRYYDRKKKNLVGKKSPRCLSGRCGIVITTGKKIQVVCLAGARLLLRPEKKGSSRDFYAKLNVSNLNVTNLY